MDDEHFQVGDEQHFQVGDTLVAWHFNGRHSDTRFVRVLSVTRAGSLRVQELQRVTTTLHSNAHDGKWEQRPGEGVTENKYLVRKSREGYSFYINDRRYYCHGRYDPQKTYTDTYISD